MPTARHARAAVQARRALRAFSAEIRIGYGLAGFLPLARKENRDFGRVKFIGSTDFLRHLRQRMIARAQLWIDLSAEHPIRRVIIRLEYVFPIIQTCPTAGFEKGWLRYRQGAGVHQRAPPHARAGENIQMPEKTQAHDTRPFQRGNP